VLDAHRLQYQLSWSVTAQPFMTAPGPLTDALIAAVRAETGCVPELSTSGGTSDGRFLATIAREVVEFGPLNDSIHKIDERVRIADIGPLSIVYERTAATLLDR
jgi:succinyl-diaminopimelate desuccinylase